MSEVVDTLREGDVYRWSYREPGDDRTYGRYHCCSRIAIVRNGRLRDTFWMIGTSFPSSDGRSFGTDDLPKLELTRLGNLAEYEKAPEYNGDYFDDADIMNLNHSNSSTGNFYLRKGAKRSAAKMLESAHYHMGRAEATLRSAASRIEQLREVIAKIEAGNTTDIYL